MSDGLSIGYLVALFLVVVIAGLTIGTALLYGAIDLFNRLAGKDQHVPTPTFGRAFQIVVTVWLLNLLAGIGIGLVLAGVGGVEPGSDSARTISIIANVVAVPVDFLILAAMISSQLPTSFGRAIAITTLYCALAILVVIVIFVAFMIIGALVMFPSISSTPA